MRKPLLLSGVVVAFFAANASAVNPTITVGNSVLLPNRAGQTVTINVSGGTAVSGLDFNAEIAGGGAINGGTAGPVITAVNLVTGTIFAGNNSGQQNIPSNSPQVYEGGIATTSGTVTATGLLATLTIDTTGFQGNTFSLKLSGFGSAGASGNTDFGVDSNLNPIPANITNGNLVTLFNGDANKDGTVNNADFLIVQSHYNTTTGNSWTTGDFNNDGTVNFTDFMLMTQQFTRSINLNPAPPAAAVPAFDSAAVPEPGAIAALFAAVAAFVPRRRARYQASVTMALTTA
jgi:hypothetical protein